MKRFSRSFKYLIGSALALALVVVTGCTAPAHRHLKVTEVGKRMVELYLDEPASQSLRLGDGMVLEVRSNNGGTIQTSTVGLGSASQPVQGGSFLMVWEQNNYTGPPVGEDFPSGVQGTVPGIKVPDNFFGDIDDKPSEIRLVGERNRVSGLLVVFPMFTPDLVDDVVRFGTPDTDRPETGGTFVPNPDPANNPSGTLTNPAGTLTLQRRWGPSGPIDTDQESDWIQFSGSWGEETP